MVRTSIMKGSDVFPLPRSVKASRLLAARSEEEGGGTSFSLFGKLTDRLAIHKEKGLLPALLAVLLDLLKELGELRERFEDCLADLERLRAAESQLRRQRVRRLPIQHPVHHNLRLGRSAGK